jgi:hypothetical protein
MPTVLSDSEIRALYGEHAVISRKGRFSLVHLDSPSPAVARRRSREFDPERVFCPDCPLCSLLNESGVVVFDDSVLNEAES